MQVGQSLVKTVQINQQMLKCGKQSSHRIKLL